MKQNTMLAMILAGGRGSRLHDLTNKVAKPAVSYGGKYRIVDFPLSNCANSGIDIVGVLTETFEFMRDFEGEIPGAKPEDCGNYLDSSLPMCKWWSNRYLNEVLYNITEEQMVYPKQ